MKLRSTTAAAAVLVMSLSCGLPAEQPVTVRDPGGFRQAVAQAGPGTRILVAPGVYPGAHHFARVQGLAGRPIVVSAADLAKPPVFDCAGEGLQFSDAAYLELRDLVITNVTGNGLNIDDGGSFETPSREVVLAGLRVAGSGPPGNRDGIKLSGVVNFRIEGCVIEGWGVGGGSGIDMVGCHEGLIVSNILRHTDGTGSTGIQAKGGTAKITIRRNRFENAGGRAVNVGGSTGLEFFRPPLKKGAEHAEARSIRIEGNTFIGSAAPLAFVGVDGAIARHNTIYLPKRWALRILQETRNPGFVPSRNVEFADNLVVFRSTEWAEGGVNIGSGTAPETFKFARNWWHCLDDPGRSRPRLPGQETDGVYGQAPVFRDAPTGDLRLAPGSPPVRAGADHLED